MPVKRKSSRNASKLSRNVKITQNRSKRASQKKRGRSGRGRKSQRGGGTGDTTYEHVPKMKTHIIKMTDTDLNTLGYKVETTRSKPANKECWCEKEKGLIPSEDYDSTKQSTGTSGVKGEFYYLNRKKREESESTPVVRNGNYKLGCYVPAEGLVGSVGFSKERCLSTRGDFSTRTKP